MEYKINGYPLKCPANVVVARQIGGGRAPEVPHNIMPGPPKQEAK